MASRGRGETEPTEHGPSTLTGIDHDDENDLLKDLTEIKELYIYIVIYIYSSSIIGIFNDILTSMNKFNVEAILINL